MPKRCRCIASDSGGNDISLGSTYINQILFIGHFVPSVHEMEKGNVMSMPVCLSVCLSVCSHSLQATHPNFAKLFVHVDCGRGSSSSKDVALHHVAYFRFCGLRHVFTQLALWRVMCIPRRREHDSLLFWKINVGREEDSTKVIRFNCNLSLIHI